MLAEEQYVVKLYIPYLKTSCYFIFVNYGNYQIVNSVFRSRFMRNRRRIFGVALAKRQQALVVRRVGRHNIGIVWRGSHLADRKFWKSVCSLWRHLYHNGIDLGLESR